MKLTEHTPETFKQLSPEEALKVIAQDVLDRIKTGEFIPRRGPMYSVFDPKTGDHVFPRLNQLRDTPVLHVCVAGAIIASGCKVFTKEEFPVHEVIRQTRSPDNNDGFLMDMFEQKKVPLEQIMQGIVDGKSPRQQYEELIAASYVY